MAAVSNGKRKPRRFSLTSLPFAHRANESYPFADGLNRLNGLAHLHMHVHKKIHLHVHIYIYTAVPDGKRITESQAIFLNPFTVCSSSNGSLSFVCLLMKKQKEVIRLQTDKTD